MLSGVRMEITPGQRRAAIEFGARVHAVTARVGKTELARRVGDGCDRNVIVLITGGRGYSQERSMLVRVLAECEPFLASEQMGYMSQLISTICSSIPPVSSAEQVRMQYPLTWSERRLPSGRERIGA